MSKLNRYQREFKTKFRRCTIVRPDIKTANQMSGTTFDYTNVPVIKTRGEWPMIQSLSDESMIRFAIHARQLGVL